MIAFPADFELTKGPDGSVQFTTTSCTKCKFRWLTQSQVGCPVCEVAALRELVKQLKNPPWKKGVLEASSRSHNQEPRPPIIRED